MSDPFENMAKGILDGSYTAEDVATAFGIPIETFHKAVRQAEIRVLFGDRVCGPDPVGLIPSRDNK